MKKKRRGGIDFVDRAVFVLALVCVAGVLGVGTSMALTARSGPQRSHFANAKILASFLDRQLKTGCSRFTYVVRPGQAFHPSDEGLTPESLGIGKEAFEMNDRLIEDGACFIGSSVLGMQKFESRGLSLRKYESWLQSAILPEACAAFSEVDSLTETVWRDGTNLWNVEPGEAESGDIEPLPVEQRRAIAKKIAHLVDGVVVTHNC